MRIAPLFKRAILARVEVIDAMRRKALCFHAQGGWYVGEWDLDELELIEEGE